jgi:hypothetical protein
VPPRWCLAATTTVSLLTGLASSARAQAGYVGGIAFADVQRASGETSSTYGSIGATKLDGTAAGGGVRGGVFLAPRLTLELAVDFGGPIDHTTTPQIIPLRGGDVAGLPPGTIAGLPGVAIPGYVLPQFELKVRTKTTATSVLLAYHLAAWRRFRPGFAGGLSFVRTSTTTSETIRYTFVGNSIVPPPLVAPFTTTTDAVLHQVAATVGGELAMDLSRHSSVVPEIRALGFDNRLVLRPGIGFRWQW